MGIAVPNTRYRFRYLDHPLSTVIMRDWNRWYPSQYSQTLEFSEVTTIIGKLVFIILAKHSFTCLWCMFELWMTHIQQPLILALVNSRHQCQLRSFKYAAQFRWITRIAFSWWLRLWKRLSTRHITRSTDVIHQQIIIIFFYMQQSPASCSRNNQHC